MSVLRFAVAGAIAVIAALAGDRADARQYAAFVMDARTGQVLHERRADTKLHPASLTKMMTLYLTFEAVASGRIKLDRRVRVSRHAARQVPSKLGLRAGQRVTIRDMIRATAVKSANDAAVVLAEAIGGSEREFARMMTSRARQLGMRNTTFKNASGLTAKGQLSTARDMAVLGRALFYDFPQYYNLFGRKQTVAAGRRIYSTNRRFLSAYDGADGIKTGYTRAAGFNLVSSAKRGDKRIIAAVFGGRSTATRNAKMAELLDIGFRKAPRYAPVQRWASIRVKRSPTPLARPGQTRSVSLLAQAGAALTPSAAHAAEAPQTFTAYSPKASPSPLPRPGDAPSAIAAAPAAEEPGAPIPTPRPAKARKTVGDWAVQLGVFAKKETAIAELTSAALSDVGGLDVAGREISETRLAGEAVYRARLTGFDKQAARSACAALKSRGKACLPVVASQDG